MTDVKPTPAWRDEFLAAGYKPYHDSFKARGEEHVPDDRRMYVGSVQKRVRDGRGTRYFLSVDLYDFTMHQGGRRSASVSVQFQMADEDHAGCADVRRHIEGSVSETEAWFADLWHRMGWGYYEADDASVPAANKPSEALCPFNDEGAPDLPDDFGSEDPCPICGARDVGDPVQCVARNRVPSPIRSEGA